MDVIALQQYLGQRVQITQYRNLLGQPGGGAEQQSAAVLRCAQHRGDGDNGCGDLCHPQLLPETQLVSTYG